ncbi:MAG TPA: methylenetetrahydrofolate reductase [Acidimicrobiales bacterium]|nr:methylenetetrahydrofolate reductase [Acidimicrobiales bacterium]
MTRIADLLDDGPTVSFEFFPPKTDEAGRVLEKTVADLASLDPTFVSVTYGAGGSTRERTRDIVIGINRTHDFPAMAHLTCVGHTREQIATLLDEYSRSGVENILALGGDPPTDGSEVDGDFTHANELVAFVRTHGSFSIGVAAFPELHPRSPDRETDRRHLAAKLAAADFGVTQFFFEAAHYRSMVAELSALGCETTVLPGLMLFNTVGGLTRMSAMNGTHVPEDLLARLDGVADFSDEMRAVAVDAATQLGRRLLDEGAPGIHLYALNRSEAATEVLHNLGLR